ncbi:MAG: acyl-CoA dehydrogenase family protein [Desulfitobacteriaceae bacterium]|nr:acyl-CoA dehydrogenase family protein [Desulfitobacteriaceae bacterium]MDI6914477.1 acyl-CoA dehydrogenase family protein [Desulfitobacteriaceae bacterium]
MDFELSDEIKLMQSTMRKFVQNECLPLERQLCYSDPDWVELPEDTYKEMVQKVKNVGFWATAVPEKYGGAGLDPLTMCVIEVEKSKTTIGTAHHNPFGGNPPGILYKCKGEQIEKYLLPVIRGEKRTAMANTEPGAGSDAGAITTSAVKKGDHWVINGRKLFSTMSDKADFVFVTTVTDKEKRGRGGITMFIVDKGTPGFTVTRHVDVIRPQYSTELVFEDVVVPDSQVLGEVGQGFLLFQEWASYGRIMMAASCIGRAERAFQMSRDHSKQRVTFGQPLSQRQGIQWMLVDSAIEIKQAWLMMLECAWKLGRGEDVRQETAMLKLFATEMAFRVLDRAIQIHGGIGLTKELPLERWFREVRVMRIVEGASEIQRFVIGRNIVR